MSDSIFARVALLLVLAAALAPSEASAQGFAPAKGSTWVKLGFIYSDATQNFAGTDELIFDPSVERGSKVDFRSRRGEVVGGELDTQELTLDAVYSPFEGGVIGLFMPVRKRVYYENPRPYVTTETGAGDLQLYAGYQLTPRDQSRLGSSFYVRGKVPFSRKYPYTNEALLGEGQFDLSVIWANTFALEPNIHLNSSVELKKRFGWLENDPNGLFATPGDEAHWSLGIGAGVTSWLWLSGTYSGFRGTPWLISYREPGFVRDTQPTLRMRRSLHSVSLGAYVMFGKWVGLDGLALDLFAKAPLAGEDHAVMRSFGAGLAYGF